MMQEFIVEVQQGLYKKNVIGFEGGLEPMHYLNFIFRCYRKFGPENMPWAELLPRPDLRSYAESIGVLWDLA
jgi:hypothetical protein